MSRTYGKAQDLIDFTRTSGGTALRRVKYGAELTTNGDFSTGDFTGWTITGTDATHTITLENGGARYQSDTTSPVLFLTQQNLVNTSKLYQITVVISDYVSGSLKIDTTNGPVIFDGNGTFVYNVSPSSVNVGLYRTTTNVDMIIQSLSVKEVTFDTSDGDLTLFNHPNNIPRIEYDANGNLLGLLVEESRTNLITYSESFDNSSYWTLLFSTLGSGYSAPDGSNNAYLLTASSSSYYIYRAGAHVGLTTISMFMKAGTSNIGGLYSTGGISCVARFNLSTGTVDFIQDCTATITAVGNGWYRCSATYTNTSTGNMGFFVPNATAGDSVYIFGFQSEAGAFPTSYVPSNSGSTTTRSADVASIGVDGFGYNDEAGTVVFEGTASQVGDPASSQVFVEIGTSNRSDIYLLSRLAGTSESRLLVNDGVTQSDLRSTDFVGGVSGKMAGSWKVNDFAISTDGGAVQTDTSGNLPESVTIMGIGTLASLAGNYLNGHIKSIKYYPRRLLNSQLVELTS